MKPFSLKIEKTGTGVQFTVKAVPGSSRTSIAGALEGALRVKIAAPRKTEKPTGCCWSFSAGFWGFEKIRLQLLPVRLSPVKILRIDRITPEQILQTLKEDKRTNE